MSISNRKGHIFLAWCSLNNICRRDVLQRLMAYIVNLILVLQLLFLVVTSNNLPISRRLIKVTFAAYHNSVAKSQVHTKIREHVKRTGLFSRTVTARWIKSSSWSDSIATAQRWWFNWRHRFYNLNFRNRMNSRTSPPAINEHAYARWERWRCASSFLVILVRYSYIWPLSWPDLAHYTWLSTSMFYFDYVPTYSQLFPCRLGTCSRIYLDACNVSTCHPVWYSPVLDCRTNRLDPMYRRYTAWFRFLEWSCRIKYMIGVNTLHVNGYLYARSNIRYLNCGSIRGS